jgi:hypothetical protein
MQVVRLERSFLNLPRSQPPLTLWIDYARVAVGEKFFWLPKNVRAEQVVRTPKQLEQKLYLAEYTNYRKFDVSVTIKY